MNVPDIHNHSSWSENGADKQEMDVRQKRFRVKKMSRISEPGNHVQPSGGFTVKTSRMGIMANLCSQEFVFPQFQELCLALEYDGDV